MIVANRRAYPDEVTRDDLAQPVRQVAGGRKFEHAGIDERPACVSCAPRAESLRIMARRGKAAETDGAKQPHAMHDSRFD